MRSHSSPRLQLLMDPRECLFRHDSKMRFKISPHRNSDKPVRHYRLNLDEKLEVGTGLSVTIGRCQFPQAMIASEISAFEIGHQLSAW